MCLIGVNWLRTVVGASWSAIALERLKTPLSLTWWLDSALDRYIWATRTKAIRNVVRFSCFRLMWTSFCSLSLRLRLVPPAGQSDWQNTTSWWGKNLLMFLESLLYNTSTVAEFPQCNHKWAIFLEDLGMLEVQAKSPSVIYATPQLEKTVIRPSLVSPFNKRL